MFWALDANGEYIQAAPGVRGVCPMCNNEVFSRTGDVVTWHFAHKGKRYYSCDYWSETETEWHLTWKSMVPQHMREIVLKRPISGTDQVAVHRADILNSRGTVIELQHSRILLEDVRERESFYQNMIWIFDLTEREFTKKNVDRSYDKKSTRPTRDRFHIERVGDYHEFTWTRPKEYVLATTAPTFLDFGGRDLFMIRTKTHTHPSRGRGFLVSKNEFKSLYFK